MAGELDVVVFGAGGVTGRNVAAYLAERAAEGSLKWAAAGRDPRKVQRVLDQLGVTPPEILSADVSDPAEPGGDGLEHARGARPRRPLHPLRAPRDRRLHGRGAHYADLTGELPFVRGIIDAHHQRASRPGSSWSRCAASRPSRPTCWWQSWPSWRAEPGDGLRSVDLEVEMTAPPGWPHASDMVSGGTFQSMAILTGEENAARALDPAVLIPDEAAAARCAPAARSGSAPRRGGDGAVIAPMAPAPYINPGVIHRSALLRAEARWETFEPFRYREGIAFGGRR